MGTGLYFRHPDALIEWGKIGHFAKESVERYVQSSLRMYKDVAAQRLRPTA